MQNVEDENEQEVTDKLADYDILIIGAGPGGYVAAEEAALEGKTVAVVERNFIGGTCLNVGCIPSKTYLEYASWLDSINEANNKGMDISVNEINFSELVNHKNKVVSTLQGGIQSTFKANNIEYIEGEAKYKDRNTFEVNGKTITASNIILATGSHPFVPKINGLEEIDYYTTDTFFEMDYLPKKLVIIGGGIIASELAYALNRLGVDVTLIEVAPDILMNQDPDARKTIKRKFKKSGIEIIVDVEIDGVFDNKVRLTNNKEFNFDELLVATGRKANLELPRDMGLTIDEDTGTVVVDDYYQTSHKNVYAIGDLIGGHQLAHAASAEGVKAVKAIIGKREKPINPNSVPRPLFTSPEVSSFGLSLDEAKKAGYDAIEEQIPFSVNGRAIATSSTEGFVKIVTERKYGEILGSVIVGKQAGDLLHQLLTVRESEGTVEEVARVVFAHPTLSEVTQDVSKELLRSINK